MLGVSKMQAFFEGNEGKEMSCYLHNVPGRIRIKTPLVKGKHAIAQDLEEKIRVLPGVKMVSANALTGSILVHYDENGIDAGAIADLVSRETGLDLSGAAHPDRYVEEALSKAGEVVGEKIGKAVLGLVIGQLLEGSPLALLAAVI